MAVQTGPGKHPVRFGWSPESLKTRVDGTRVSAPIVTALTELRYSTHQKLGMIAPMGRMAAQTVLLNRRMLPHVWASFLRMTLVTEVIGSIRLDHFGAESAMMIMAVRTF